MVGAAVAGITVSEGAAPLAGTRVILCWPDGTDACDDAVGIARDETAGFVF